MKKRLILSSLLALCVIAGGAVLLHGVNFDVLNPKGVIAEQQRDLLVFTVLLSLVVVIPVFTLLAVISWKYRATNKKATYKPDWDSNKTLEIIWWGIPIAIIATLSVVVWISSHKLDPYRALDSDVKPVNVQVVALQWKWLFIYPDLNVASVNELHIPSKTPVNFTITSDAPMNSFWIPSLAGQVYAMSGMSTKLHIMANENGSYDGSSANISGKEFAKMKFKTIATSKTEFDDWASQTNRSNKHLNATTYEQLAKPGSTDKPIFYALDTHDLYDTIVMKYMMPQDKDNQANTETMPLTHEHMMDHNMSDMPDMSGMEEKK